MRAGPIVSRHRPYAARYASHSWMGSRFWASLSAVGRPLHAATIAAAKTRSHEVTMKNELRRAALRGGRPCLWSARASNAESAGSALRAIPSTPMLVNSQLHRSLRTTILPEADLRLLTRTWSRFARSGPRARAFASPRRKHAQDGYFVGRSGRASVGGDPTAREPSGKNPYEPVVPTERILTLGAWCGSRGSWLRGWRVRSRPTGPRRERGDESSRRPAALSRATPTPARHSTMCLAVPRDGY